VVLHCRHGKGHNSQQIKHIHIKYKQKIYLKTIK